MAAYKERHKEEIAAKKAAKLAAKAHLRTPKGGYFLKFTSVEEQRAAARAQSEPSVRRAQAKIKARNAAARAKTLAAATVFIRAVPPLLGSAASAIRTRLFIALCEHGPITMRDVGRCISTAAISPREIAMEHLVAQGIVVKVRTRSVFTYYMNPGHPAHAEMMAFGRRLATRWPSPARPTRDIDQVAVPVGSTVPCELFGREVRTRTLLLIAVSGGMSPAHAHSAGLMVSRDEIDRTLRGAQRQGLVAREPVPTGAGARKGQPRRYFLDSDFFAYREFRALLFALTATVHQDIAGLARAVARRDPYIARHLARYDRETAHLRPA
ncbi:MAG TPA: hypothetical protein VGU66_11370 [Candidatus Elarobacter sp.]|nr:hypothetical protein [Candidatus Elarobacter sp.]